MVYFVVSFILIYKYIHEENSFDKNDAQTLKKRQQVKEKLTKNTEITEDVEELLISIEQYCFIILQSLN